MPRRKKTKPRPKPDSEVKEPPMRKFYVNGKFEFGFWYDPAITDKEEIMEKFFADHNWKFMVDYCGWKVDKYRFSEDLEEVYIDLKRTRKRKKTSDGD
jgi:hypothetical protein